MVAAPPQSVPLQWDLPPGRTFLNHGSFGLAPRELLQWRFELLQQIEHDPVHFLTEQLPPQLAEARQGLAGLLGAQPQQVAFVPSTTYGLNELLQRLPLLEPDLAEGSEILLASHAYNATVNLVRFAAEQRGWRMRLVELPWPQQGATQVVEAFAQAWSTNTRVLVLDHITSPSALELPLEPLIALARSRGARVIVDGAHAPGLVPLRLDALQPDAYVGNLHKWLCCPRGSAFLWVGQRWVQRLRPLVVSHGANAPVQPGVCRFHLEHDWLGTADPTPWLALPQVLRLFQWPTPPQWPQRMADNAARAQRGRGWLLEALLEANCAPLDVSPQGTEQLAMAAVPLPCPQELDGVRLQQLLYERGFQVPVIPLRPHCPELPQFLRISCFDYTSDADLQRLAAVLPGVLALLRAESQA